MNSTIQFCGHVTRGVIQSDLVSLRLNGQQSNSARAPEVTRTTAPLFPIEESSFCRGYLPLLPLIKENENWELDFEFTRLTALPTPAELNPTRHPNPTAHVVDDVYNNEMGIIVVARESDKVRILAEILEAFPENSFAVATAGHRTATKLVRNLRNDFGLNIEHASRNFRGERRGRICIGQINAVMDYRTEFSHRDVLIYLEAKDGLLDWGFNNENGLADFHGRVFGFMKHSESCSRFHEEQLCRRYGFHRTIVPALGKRPRRINVEWVNLNSAPHDPVEDIFPKLSLIHI